MDSPPVPALDLERDPRLDPRNEWWVAAVPGSRRRAERWAVFHFSKLMAYADSQAVALAICETLQDRPTKTVTILDA